MSLDLRSVWALLSGLSVWKVLGFFLLAINIKCLPFMWHYRFFIPILTALRRKLPSQATITRKLNTQTPTVFLPIITTTTVPLLEGDFNLHKSNSTYFTDLDSSRSHLLSFLCLKGVIATDRELSAEGKKGFLVVLLGSVQTTFKKEIALFQPYEVWSRILTWDRKWIYIVTHFVKKGAVKPAGFLKHYARQQKQQENGTAHKTKPEREDANSNRTEENQKEKPSTKLDDSSTTPTQSFIYATSISKCIFKKGRLTVPPERILRASGFLTNTEDEKEDEFNIKDRIEAERIKGIKYAKLLSGLEELQEQLLREDEVNNGVIALGNFSDFGYSLAGSS